MIKCNHSFKEKYHLTAVHLNAAGVFHLVFVSIYLSDQSKLLVWLVFYCFRHSPDPL